jgi:hypothetical protein
MQNDEQKDGVNPEQTRLPSDEPVIDRATEIDEVCRLIPDFDVRLCAQRLFVLADETSDRKLSTVDVMRLVMILTGKNRRSALNSMLERMKTYRICMGCELGHSLIINKPKDVKQFLLEMGLGRQEKQHR